MVLFGTKAEEGAQEGAKMGAKLGSKLGPLGAGIGAGFGGASGYVAGAFIPECPGKKLLPDGGQPAAERSDPETTEIPVEEA